MKNLLPQDPWYIAITFLFKQLQWRRICHLTLWTGLLVKIFFMASNWNLFPCNLSPLLLVLFSVRTILPYLLHDRSSDTWRQLFRYLKTSRAYERFIVWRGGDGWWPSSELIERLIRTCIFKCRLLYKRHHLFKKEVYRA